MENKSVVEEKPSKKMDKKTILTIVGNVLFYAVIIVLFLFSLMNINAGNGSKDFPHLFGKGMLSVQTTSMERNEGGYNPEEWKTYKIQEIMAGDLVYDKVFKEKNFSQLKVGDVITFYDASIGSNGALNTHRIVYIGETFVICQGDKGVTMSESDTYAFDTSDPLSAKNAKLEEAGETQVVFIENIKGVVYKVSPGAGKILDNVRQNWLFYFVIPVAVVLLIEVFLVFKNILDLKNEKNKAALATDKEAMMADLEAEKEKMRQQLLAELMASQQNAAKEETKEEAVQAVEESKVEESEEPKEE